MNTNLKKLIDVKGLFESVALALSKVEFSECDEKIKQLRKESIVDLLPLILAYQSEGFRIDLVKRVLDAKLAYLLQATSKAEVAEILKISVSYYNYEKLMPKGRFHVEEEELFMLSYASMMSKLTQPAIDRFKELFEKCCGLEVV